MKHLLIILISILLLSTPLFGQSGKPQTIIIPTGSLGDISEVRKKMLEKTLESKLDDYFAIVPKELFEEAQEQAFQEMDADECTEDQCSRMIQEILQIENAFKMDLMYEEGDTQISITWNDQDQKRVEEDYCEGCKTKGLRLMIGGLVEKLVGVKKVFKDEPVVQKIEKDKTKEMFVTVGEDGIIFTSSDGNTWTNKRTSGTSKDIYEVTYGNSTFVTVGENGTILTSLNGTTWTKRISGTSKYLYGVTYGKGLFVVVGENGTIITSTDEYFWTERTSVTSVDLFGVTYSQ